MHIYKFYHINTYLIIVSFLFYINRLVLLLQVKIPLVSDLLAAWGLLKQLQHQMKSCSGCHIPGAWWKWKVSKVTPICVVGCLPRICWYFWLDLDSSHPSHMIKNLISNKTSKWILSKCYGSPLRPPSLPKGCLQPTLNQARTCYFWSCLRNNFTLAGHPSVFPHVP